MDQLPLVFERLLIHLKHPIPNVPVSTEPSTVHHSSSSLAGALVDSSSNATPLAVTQQSDVVAQLPGDNAVVSREAPSVLPDVRSHDPVSTPGARTQAIGNTAPQPSGSSSTTLMNPPPTSASQYTITVPNDAPRRGYQPMDHSQVALVPRRNFTDVIPTTIQGQISQPQLSKWVPYHVPEASTSTLPRQPPVKVQPSRKPDRYRLAKDILKQLGKPSGSVPAVLTRREYEERKNTEIRMKATSTQPPAEPVVPGPQPLLNHDDLPPPSEIVPVSDQAPPLGLSSNPPPSSPADEPPLLEYPDLDTGSTTHDAGATGEDVNTDIPPPEDPLVPQPPASPKSNLLLLSPAVPEPALDKEERPAVDQLPLPNPQSSERSGPPPGAEIIEISDDEEQTALDVGTTVVEPMEIDEEVGAGGAIPRSLSELSQGRDNTVVAVETEKDFTKEPLGRQPSPGPIDVRVPERKLRKYRPLVEVPPLPDWARQNRGGEKAAIQEEDEEGLYEVSTLQDRLLTLLIS